MTRLKWIKNIEIKKIVSKEIEYDKPLKSLCQLKIHLKTALFCFCHSTIFSVKFPGVFLYSVEPRQVYWNFWTGFENGSGEDLAEGTKKKLHSSVCMESGL